MGWYHSHPGYGCWLSGIDCGTQMMQQQYSEPFLAIVVDPHRTIAAGKVEIGAFRTYPEARPALPPTPWADSIQSNLVFGSPAGIAAAGDIIKYRSIPQSEDRKLTTHCNHLQKPGGRLSVRCPQNGE